jgi:hypothetical protein
MRVDIWGGYRFGGFGVAKDNIWPRGKNRTSANWNQWIISSFACIIAPLKLAGNPCSSKADGRIFKYRLPPRPKLVIHGNEIFFS